MTDFRTTIGIAIRSKRLTRKVIPHVGDIARTRDRRYFGLVAIEVLGGTTAPQISCIVTGFEIVFTCTSTSWETNISFWITSGKVDPAEKSLESILTVFVLIEPLLDAAFVTKLIFTFSLQRTIALQCYSFCYVGNTFSGNPGVLSQYRMTGPTSFREFSHWRQCLKAHRLRKDWLL